MCFLRLAKRTKVCKEIVKNRGIPMDCGLGVLRICNSFATADYNTLLNTIRNTR